MEIFEIHHAQITIPKGSEDEARRFYCELLGLPEIQKPESLQGRGGLWIQVGGRQVHLGIQDDIDRHNSRSHLAYQVDNAAAWRSYLETNGVEIGDSVPISGHERFEFRDPFGNRVEFIQPIDEG